MSAIKLPVTVWRHNHLKNHWMVCDGYISKFGDFLTRKEADQIALAMNTHDELVNALKFYARQASECRNRLDANLPGTMNDWTAEICMDGGDVARAALAKIEPMKGAKP